MRARPRPRTTGPAERAAVAELGGGYTPRAMVMTASQMLELGTPLPDVRLPDADGTEHALLQMQGAKGTLVVFMCNHCPFVKLIRDELASLGRDCESRGVTMVGVNSNDYDKYPDDSPARMKDESKRYGYTFAYLLDEEQSVAKAFRAACTPDFFLYDASGKLAYRGQLDGARPGNGVDVTGVDLRAALDAVIDGGLAAVDQTPSIGCNIKWKDGNAPAWFG